MARVAKKTTRDILSRHEGEICSEWTRRQLASKALRSDLMNESELREQSREFLALFRAAVQSGDLQHIGDPAWTPVREFLDSISRSRALQGFTPSETATFVFSLKEPLFERLRTELKDEPATLWEELWAVGGTLDELALYTMQAYQRGREEVIRRQQQELMDLSTPVVQLWQGILALPLIGTLDSERAQVVMESLLQRIVETGSSIAIIDITGVPTVDTLVAQHLMKTVAAARLMGADCIISGIRPQIAQTIVHLGVNLADVTTKATLADAFVAALKRTNAKLPGPGGS